MPPLIGKLERELVAKVSRGARLVLRVAAREVAYRRNRIANSRLGRQYYADVSDRQTSRSRTLSPLRTENKTLQFTRSGTRCPVVSPSHVPWSNVSWTHSCQRQAALTRNVRTTSLSHRRFFAC